MLLLLLRLFGRALLVVVAAALVGAGSAGAATVVDRDEFSTTVDLGGGKRSTTLSSEPLNFQSGSGAWQPLDLELEPAGDGDLHPGGVDGDVAIPESLAEPVELEHDGRSASFRLLGAVGEADVDGAEAGFDRAMPGVNVSYVARAYGVKETLELLSGSAPRVFAYDLRASALWSASMDRGDVVLRDSAGVERYRVSAPLAWDSAEDPAFTNALALSVVRVSAGRWRVTLRPDAAWLGDRARTFPVFIDPDFSWSNGATTFNGAQDCYLSGATQANYTFCAQTYLQTGWYNRPYRSIFKFDIAAAIPTNATVSSAVFKAYAPPATPHIAMGHSLHTITSDWDSTATWNRRKPGVAWSTAGGGGDISTDPAYTGSSTTVQAYSAWYSWNAPLAAVQGWVNGSLPNYGFMLRSDATTNIGNAYVWASTEASMSSQFPADSSKWPKLDVSWTAPSPDQVAPALALSGPLASLGDGWSKDPQAELTVAATDAGSGVTQLELRQGAATLGLQSQTCGAGGCSLTKTFTVDLAGLGEGTQTLTVVGIDAAGNARSQDLTVRVDRGPPALELTGSLVELQETAAASGARAVHVSATDPASGVTQLSMEVDGVVREQAQQPCPAAGGCAMTADWSLDLAGLSDGTHTVTVTATDASGRDTSRELTVRKDGYVMPQAPPLSTTAVDPFIEQVDWLWTGSSPLQTGVAAGTITAKRAAVITGNVFNEDGDPAGGVTVSVVDHPELGSTKSRSNGKYFLGVNGGGLYRVRFEVQGALGSEREVQTSWTEYSVVDDVWLVGIDPQGTQVAFGDAAPAAGQLASGSVVSDADGTRRTRVFVKAGTKAWAGLPSGGLQPLLGGTVRVTEFTVGEHGPERMPAALPPTTGYTFAADFRVDEAAAMGAEHVYFDRPVMAYVDNFIGFPVGMTIPAATYERGVGEWTADPDGRVIKVVDEVAGKAVVDVYGFGPANASELSVFGFDDAELAQLADLYEPGDTFWRVPRLHFSPADFNHPVLLPDGLQSLNGRPSSGCQDCQDVKQGSIIGVQNQTLGETADLGGTPHFLRYDSSNVPGALGARSVRVPVTGPTVSPSLESVRVAATFAGQRIETTVRDLEPNQAAVLRWDGKDAFDRPMVGGVRAQVVVSQAYKTSYSSAAGGLVLGGGGPGVALLPGATDGLIVSWGDVQRLFGRRNSVSAMMMGAAVQFPEGAQPPQPVDRPQLVCDATETSCWYPVAQADALGRVIPEIRGDLPSVTRRFTVPIPSWDARGAGLGGWMVSAQHHYDAGSGTVFYGNGERRSGSSMSDVITTVRDAFPPDTPAELQERAGTSLAMLADGSAVRTNTIGRVVLRDWPDGHVSVFAGTLNEAGSSGDGGPATQARLSDVQGIAVGPDQSVYIADGGADRVRKVAPDGTITTVAGNGTNGATDIRLPATDTAVDGPVDVAVGADDTLYIAASEGIYSVQGRRISRIAGGASCSTEQSRCSTYSPRAGSRVAVAPDGTLYWAAGIGQSGAVDLFRLRPSDSEGKLLGTSYFDGVPSEARFDESDVVPLDLAVDAEGRLLMVDNLWGRAGVWRLEENGSRDPDGSLIQYVKKIALQDCKDAGARYIYVGEGGPAGLACGDPVSIATGPDGVYVLDQLGGMRRIARALSGFSQGDILLPSEDGDQVFRFDSSGRHLQTLDARNKNVLLSFAYDAQGRLATITTIDGDQTTFSYAGGQVTVTGADGQQTTVTIGSGGWASQITDARGASQQFTYGDSGLMLTRTDELGATSSFTWGATGRLLTDTSAEGVAQTLGREESGNGTAVTHSRGTTNAEVSTYATKWDGESTQLVEHTAPDGTLTSRRVKSEGLRTATTDLPDGSKIVATEGAGDPRFGSQVPTGESTMTLPEDVAPLQKLKIFSGTSRQLTRDSGADPADPFAFRTLIDTWTRSGATNDSRRSWTSVYDKDARTSTSTSPLGRRQVVTEDQASRPVLVTQPGRDDVEVSYDARGRPVSVVQGLAAQTTAYGADGYVQSSTDAEQHTTTFARDALGRPTTITAPDGTTTLMQWDAASQLQQLTAPDGRRYDYEYNDDGRQTAMTRTARAGSGGPTLTTNATYDDHGRVASVTRPSGNTVTRTFDAQGRLAATQASDGTEVTRQFEAVSSQGSGGRLQSLTTNQGAATTFTRNGSVVTGIAQSADTAPGDASAPAPPVSLQYDSSLRPTQQRVGSDDVDYAYNDDDQLTQAGPISVQYDQTTGDPEELSAGVTQTAVTVDTRGDLATQSTVAQTAGGPQPVLAEQLVRDRLGRITQRTATDDSGTHIYAYTYDARGHLTQVTRDGVTVESYAYDASGGLASRGSGVLVSAFTTDGHGRPVSSADGTSASWNADGELESLASTAGTAQMSYDGFGRLVQVTLPDGRVGRYRYDAVGRRTAVTLDGQLVRRLVYGASLWPQARIDAAGDVLERYVYASQAHVPDLVVRRDGQRIRLVTDAVGSVRAAVDADTGVVLQRLAYDAYGRETQNTNPGLQPFGFKGAFTDPVAEGAGLVWMGVRAYTPKLARFTTPDPVGLKAGWNQHDALAGDPINLIDADGRFAIFAPLAIRAAMVAGQYLLEWAAAAAVGYGLNELLDSCIDGGSDDGSDAEDAADATTGGDGPGKKPKPGASGGSGAGKDFPKRVKVAAKAENRSDDGSYSCVYCGQKTDSPQIDHAIPKVRGGNNTLDNAQVTCRHCNSSKGGRDEPVNPPPNHSGPWPRR